MSYYTLTNAPHYAEQTTPAFVESPLFKDQGVDYFASQVTFDKDGVSKIHDLGKLDASEQKLIDACLPELKKNIEKVRSYRLPSIRSTLVC